MSIRIDGVANRISGYNNAVVIGNSTLENYSESINNLGNTTASTNISLANGNFITATLATNTTFTFTLGGPLGVASFTLLLTNDATAGRTIVWPASVRWPGGTIPNRTTTANRTDAYTFFTTNNGSIWYGNLAQYNYA